MNDNEMVTDLSVDQIKYSDVFDLKLSKRRPDPTLIIGFERGRLLDSYRFSFNWNSLRILQHTSHFISFFRNSCGNNDLF